MPHCTAAAISGTRAQSGRWTRAQCPRSALLFRHLRQFFSFRSGSVRIPAMFSPALADLVDVVKGSNARQLRLLKEAAEDLRLDACQRSHRLKFTKIYMLIRHACAGERLAHHRKAPVLPSAVVTWLAGSGE